MNIEEILHRAKQGEWTSCTDAYDHTKDLLHEGKKTALLASLKTLYGRMYKGDDNVMAAACLFQAAANKRPEDTYYKSRYRLTSLIRRMPYVSEHPSRHFLLAAHQRRWHGDMDILGIAVSSAGIAVKKIFPESFQDQEEASEPEPKEASEPEVSDELTGAELVPFEGNNIIVLEHEEEYWVVLRRMTNMLGLDFSSQLRRLREAHWAGVVVITTPDSRGHAQDMTCIRAKDVPMWLAGIQTSRVSDEARPMLEKLQDRARDVLARYMLPASMKKKLEAPPQDVMSVNREEALTKVIQNLTDVVCSLARRQEERQVVTSGAQNVIELEGAEIALGRVSVNLPPNKANPITWLRRLIHCNKDFSNSDVQSFAILFGNKYHSHHNHACPKMPAGSHSVEGLTAFRRVEPNMATMPNDFGILLLSLLHSIDNGFFQMWSNKTFVWTPRGHEEMNKYRQLCKRHEETIPTAMEKEAPGFFAWLLAP
jgi:hypothetical protein